MVSLAQTMCFKTWIWYNALVCYAKDWISNLKKSLEHYLQSRSILIIDSNSNFIKVCLYPSLFLINNIKNIKIILLDYFAQ